MAPKMYLIAVAVVVVSICLAIIARNWSCRKSWSENRADRREERSNRTLQCEVASVVDGATLEVVTGRRQRTRSVIIEGVSVPSSVASDSKANLQRLVSGGKVTVLYKSSRLFAASDPPEAFSAAEMESTTPIIGSVFGDGQVNVAVAQLAAGLASCGESATAEMKAAEKLAKKNQVGQWAKTK